MIQSTDNLEATSYTHQCGDILLKLSNLKEKNSIDSEKESRLNSDKSSSKLTSKTLSKLNNDNKLIDKSSNKLSKKLDKSKDKSKDKCKDKSKDKAKDKCKDSLIVKKDLKTSTSNRKRSDIENISDLKILKRVKSEMDTLYRPLVFYGPSGSGKSSLLKKLLADFPDYFGFSVSHTTRQPRAGEVHGQDYYYVTREEMLKAIQNDEFIETAEFSGNIYGTSKKAVEDVRSKGKICILDIEVEGVKNVKKSNLNPLYIFIKPPSIKELGVRLRNRGSENEEAIDKRLTRAIDEVAFGEIEDNFDLKLVNDDFEAAYKKLKGFVLEKYGLSDTSKVDDDHEEEKPETNTS